MFKSTSYFRELCSRTTRVLLSGVLGLCLVFVFSWVLTANNRASALTSSEINYQARLLQSNGAIAPDGNYNVDFKLYSALSAGGGQAVGTCTDTGGYDCLWEETYTGVNVVTVKDGYLTVNLGSITSFPSTINWGSPLYLTMNIGGTGSPSWDGEMSPRIQLTSVPYAFEANSALTATTLSVSNGGYTDILQLTNPTAASNTITAPDATGTICLQSSASCGFVTGSGTAILQNGNSLGTTVVVGSTTAYGLNLITNNSAVESLSSTGAATFKNTSNSAGALLVENLSGSSVFGVNTSTGQTVLGNNTTSPIAGSLVLDNGNNSTPATVTVNANGSQTSNYTITLPTNGASGGLCLESSTASTSSATTLQFNSCANNSPTISVDTINTWPKSGTATSGSTATISAFTPSTDGDLLLVTTSIPASGGTVKTSPVGISDSDVTSWTKAIVSPASGSALRVEMWYGVITNTASAALTVTYTGTITSGTAEVDVTEFTAVGVNSATTWGVDNAGATSGTATSGTPINMYNGTPGNSGELYYGFANDQSAGLGSGGSCPNVPAVGTTWTCTTSAGGQSNVVDYDLNTTAGTAGGYNGQIYLGATSYNYSSVAALFLAFVNSTAINNAVSTQEANFDVQAGSPGSVAGVLESNGTGDALDLQNSAGIVASSFNNTGSLTVGNNTLTNQTASAVAFATPTVTYTVPNGYVSAVGQTITVASCSGTGVDSGTFVVTAVSSTTIAVSNTLGVAGETGCVVTTGSEGIINLEDENTAGTATGVVSLEAGIPTGSTSYNYSLLLPTTNPSTGLCLETSTASALQLVFNSCASNNPSISLQTTTGYGNNEWDTHAGTSGLTTTLTTYPETKGDLEVMTTQIPNGTSNGVTVASVSGGGVTLWHKAAVDPGNTNVDRVEVWYGIVTGLSPHSLASQTVSATTFGTPNLTYTVPTGQPFITGEYITVTGCSGTGGDNGAYAVAGFTTTSITVSDPTNGVAGETGCTVNPGWPVTVTYTPSTPGAATEVTDSEFTAVGVLPSSSWGIDTSGNSLITSASTSLSGPNLTASTSGELYYSYANEQTSSVAPEGYATCTGSPAYNCIATGQGNVIDYNDQTVLSTAYQSAWGISPTALDSNTVAVLFEAFISSTAINNTTSVQEANFDVQAATSGSVAGVLQANAAGNADILDLYNGGGTKEFTVSNTGLTTIGDSATISLIQSAWANATATGTATVSATSNLPLADWSTTQTKGDVVTLGIECASTSASVAEITGGNVSNWYNVTTQSANGYDNEIWEGTITTTATATQINITYNLNGAWSANCEVAGQEFSASVPSGATPVWSVTSTSNTITGAAATSVPVPTMSATQYGELYWSYDVTQHAATEPALQAPYFYQLTGDSKTIVYDTTFAPGTTNPTNNITQTSGTYNDVGMVISASTGSNLTDNGGAIFTGSDAQTDLQVIGASGSGAAVLNADTLNNRVNVDGTLAILASPVLATPTASGSGSALTAGQYCYEVTAIDGTAGETTPSNEKCITITLGQDVTFTWGADPGAVSYRVYRTLVGAASGSETFLYDATQLTFTDVGAYTPTGTIYPPSSTNAYGNATVVSGATSINTNLQLTVGGNGSPTGQVYVSGTLPSGPLGTATISGGTPYGLAVQGNYAYISFDSTDKLDVFDISNPANPVLVGQATTLAGPWFLAVSGHYVYVTDLHSAGNYALQIYDVSNPSSPELISTLTTDMDAPSSVFISGNYAYITNSASSTDGLEIVNVANPFDPTVASVISAGASAWNVFVQGRYAYVVLDGSSTMYVFDISNPYEPILDSTFVTNGDESQIYVSGSYAYLSGNEDTSMQIVNIDNPYSLQSADTLTTTAGGQNCTGTSASYLEGRYLYIACATSGTMEQVDVTNPYSPIITGTVAVGSNPQTLWVQGRYAYVDDANAFTLSVFDLGGIYSSSIQAGGLETGTLGVDSNALIGGTLSVGSGFTVGGSTDINGSLNAYGGAQVAGDVVIGASIGIPVPTSPTVAATCASACTTYYFYGVSATDSSGGITLMSQPGGPAAVSGVPPVDYVENNSTLSDTTNFNTITIHPDQGTSDAINSYTVYACRETSLTGTPTGCSNSTSSYLVSTINTASETADTAASATFATPTVTYTVALTPSEVKYQKVTVTGCSSAGDNGTFVVTNTTSTTIAVYDTGGAAIASGAGCSIVGTLAAEDYSPVGPTGVAPTVTTAENSTTAFVVNNAAGIALINVDTTDGYVEIGSGDGGAGTTTPALLILDDGSSITDPTPVVEGAMYYNQATNTFRCGVNGAWQDCAVGLDSANTTTASVTGSTTGLQTLATSATIPANYCTAGRDIDIIANGIYSSAATAQPIVFTIQLGTTTIGVTSTAFTPPASQTNAAWDLQYQIICNAAPGASVAVTGEGFATIFPAASANTAALEVLPMETTTTTTTTGIATNGTLATKLGVTFTGTASATNKVQYNQFIVKGE